MKEFNLKKFSTIISVLIIIALLYIFITPSFKSSTKLYSREGFYFDTIISINIYTSLKNDDAERILDECMNKCRYYESIFSRTLPDSDIGRINSLSPSSTETDTSSSAASSSTDTSSAASSPSSAPSSASLEEAALEEAASSKTRIKVSDDTLKLIDYAVSIAELSDGLVDPTVGALSDLWDFDRSDFELPTSEEIEEALASVGYENIEIDELNKEISLKSSETKLDLGFIAKGYIADAIKEYLISQNIDSAVINLGGNVLTIGEKETDTPFKIGIKNPSDPSGAPIMTIDSVDNSIVSSGNYERCITINGTKYHHILSTKTGYPVTNNLSQVTIISKKSIDGDMLSTLCYILGYENAVEFLDKNYPDVKAVFVFDDGSISEFPILNN